MLPAANIQEELGEALSRASVLQSLDSAYSGKTTPKAKVSAGRPSIGGGSSSIYAGSRSASKSGTPGKPNANDIVVEELQLFVRDNSNKTGKFFMEQIKGKSIILENVKAQTEATKFAEKEKR